MRIMASQNSLTPVPRRWPAAAPSRGFAPRYAGWAGHDLPERIQLLHRHRKLFPEKVDQSRHTRRSSGHHDALDILPAGRGTEEIKSLLDLERQNVRNRAKDLRALILADAGEGFALFEPLGIVEVQV